MESSAQIPVQYGFDTFYFLICGALVMWMAAGFAMLESGLVRAKNTAEILTKNIVLYSVASIMYLLVGYYIMYSSPEGGILPSLGFLIGDENAVDVSQIVRAGQQNHVSLCGADDAGAGARSDRPAREHNNVAADRPTAHEPLAAAHFNAACRGQAAATHDGRYNTKLSEIRIA